MPITAPGSGALLAAAVDAAEAPILDRIRALGPDRDDAQLLGLRAELRAAMWGAMLAFLAANAVVVVASVSGVTTGGGVSGPGVGAIT